MLLLRQPAGHQNKFTLTVILTSLTLEYISTILINTVIFFFTNAYYRYRTANLISGKDSFCGEVVET
jgi:hypothetical protein